MGEQGQNQNQTFLHLLGWRRGRGSFLSLIFTSHSDKLFLTLFSSLRFFVRFCLKKHIYRKQQLKTPVFSPLICMSLQRLSFCTRENTGWKTKGAHLPQDPKLKYQQQSRDLTAVLFLHSGSTLCPGLGQEPVLGLLMVHSIYQLGLLQCPGYWSKTVEMLL